MGFPIIISAPSGCGKTTIVAELLKQNKDIKRVITATTRTPRKGERDGRDYLFWSLKKFQNAIKQNKMVEWAKVHVNYYGVPKSSVDNLLKKDFCPILVIDVQGAKTIKKLYRQSVSIFIAPPSLKELKKRILTRNDGTQDIEVRLKTAEKELKQIKHYDYLVINDKFEKALEQCNAIITAEKLKVNRRK